MFLLIELENISIIEINSDNDSITSFELKTQLSQRVKIPIEYITLSIDGRILNETDTINNSYHYIRGIITSTIIGGKGGFGAILRSKAKQKGAKTTTDFGACRDLNGRRLRHVNNEILLQKATEAKTQGKKLNADEDTPSGINLWYLATPAWADGIKKNRQTKFLKMKEKTSICGDWKRSRENEIPPKDASIHWGCPRGPRCTFAHGIDDLRGESSEKIKNDKKKQEYNEKMNAKDAYISSAMKHNDDEILRNALKEGLKLHDQMNLNISMNSNNQQGSDNDKSDSIVSETIDKKNLLSDQMDETEIHELPLDDYGF